MSHPTRLHTAAEVARELGETRATFFNWLHRYTDTPPPCATYVAKRYPHGRVVVAGLWDESGIREWRHWREERETARRHARADRAAKLRAELERLENES